MSARSDEVVTDETFAELVLASAKPVLVEFWASWCAPCRMVAPVLAEIAAEYAGRLRVLKIDLDVNPRSAASYDVRGAPTMIVFSGGQVVRSIVGARPKAAMLRELEGVL